MIAVVTGASGFVGQNLVRRLKHDGHDVHCLVRPGGGEPPRGTKRSVVRYDEPATLISCKALDRADVVFHLAAATRAVRDRDFIAANVTPTRALLGALVARRLHPRFVFVSSQAAAGPAADRNRPVDEVDPPRPVEAYGRSKLEAERIVESNGEKVPVTIVRPAAVFGAHDRDFLRLFQFAVRGMIVYPGVASHWLSWLYVDDLVDALIAIVQRPQAISQKYFLGSPSPVQWRALGAEIANVVGRRVRHVDVPGPLIRAASVGGDLWGHVTGHVPLANHNKATLARFPYWVCSASRARSELGFQPSRSLPDALRETYYWYRQSGWLRSSSGASRPTT